jgi:hypothetical protein
MPALNEYVFWSIVRYDFIVPLVLEFPFAHLSLFNNADYVFNAGMIRPWLENTINYRNIQAFTNDTVVDFYSRLGVLYSEMLETHPNLHRVLFSSRNTLESYSRLINQEMQISSIEQGKIAYIKIPTFLTFWSATEIEKVSSFLEEIKEYEHLIIDIRGNGGGYKKIWELNIVYALHSDRDNFPRKEFYMFFTDSELGDTLAIEYYNELFFGRRSNRTNNLIYPELVNISDVKDNLYNINIDDLQNLNKGIRVIYSLESPDLSGTIFNDGGGITPFNGEIWLLIDGNNHSAAAWFVEYAKQTGFATLVGETSGGAVAIAMRFTTHLPNTGILAHWDAPYITDSTGRSLEEFPAQPHYFNREGMDALQTVLQIIEERAN